ncbi:hypothetical protein [Nocardioides bruguierae]|uniref:Type VII secretion system (Wss) protein ESAT-6 n=1 Tax=Nocardioides bruguierae TaxID=2945102 RepID=A0A9X2D594_9ACTN|nr:hypothetical protein [Nocardioides bruguierae]MCM0619692.1 hypothetical protein [Nocardioides bruguierae]
MTTAASQRVEALLPQPTSQASTALVADVRSRLLPLLPASWLLAEAVGFDPVAMVLDELTGGYDEIDEMAQAWDAAARALEVLAEDHRALADRLGSVWQGLTPLAAASALRAAAADLDARALAIRQVAACLRALLQAVHDLCVLAADLADEAVTVGLTALAMGPVGSVRLVAAAPRLVSLGRAAIAGLGEARAVLSGLMTALAALEGVITVGGDLGAAAAIGVNGGAALSLAVRGDVP